MALGIFLGQFGRFYLDRKTSVTPEQLRKETKVSEVVKAPEKLDQKKIDQQKILEEAQKAHARELKKAERLEEVKKEVQKSPEIVIRNFEEAYENYMRSLNEIWHEMQLAIDWEKFERSKYMYESYETYRIFSRVNDITREFMNPSYSLELYKTVLLRYREATWNLFDKCNDVVKFKERDKLPEEFRNKAFKIMDELVKTSNLYTNIPMRYYIKMKEGKMTENDLDNFEKFFLNYMSRYYRFSESDRDKEKLYARVISYLVFHGIIKNQHRFILEERELLGMDDKKYAEKLKEFIGDEIVNINYSPLAVLLYAKEIGDNKAVSLMEKKWFSKDKMLYPFADPSPILLDTLPKIMGEKKNPNKSLLIYRKVIKLFWDVGQQTQISCSFYCAF